MKQEKYKTHNRIFESHEKKWRFKNLYDESGLHWITFKAIGFQYIDVWLEKWKYNILSYKNSYRSLKYYMQYFVWTQFSKYLISTKVHTLHYHLIPCNVYGFVVLQTLHKLKEDYDETFLIIWRLIWHFDIQFDRRISVV